MQLQGARPVYGQTAMAPRLRRWVDRISGALGIPPEVALDLPKATLIGSVQVQVQNHRGILEYSPQRIRIRSRSGEIVVTGAHLRIGSIYREEMSIEGRILSVELPEGGKPA